MMISPVVSSAVDEDNQNNSRPLDVHRRSEDSIVQNAVSSILSATMEKYPPPFRLSRKATRKSIHRHMEILLLDLFIAHHEPLLPWVAQSRGNDTIHRELDSRHFRWIVEALEELGFIHQIPCQVVPQRSPRLRATSALIELMSSFGVTPSRITRQEVPLVLKNEEGVVLPIPVTRTTKSLAKGVEEVNRMLTSGLAVTLPDIEKACLEAQANGGYLDVTRNTVYRSFKGNFRRGGRFYGHWVQGLPKAIRGKLLIGGEPTVELDYTSMMPMVLYAMAGINPPHEDVYTPEIIPEEFKDDFRKKLKLVFMCLINSSSDYEMRLSSYGGCKDDGLQSYGMTFAQSSNFVRWASDTVFKPLQLFFFTKAWDKFQRNESEIALAVMLKLWKSGIVSIPIHDSFIVQEKHKEELRAAMETAFQARFPGATCPGVKESQSHLATLESQSGQAQAGSSL